MPKTITVASHTNNIKGARPRVPFVQLLGPDPHTGSICFHPKHGESLAAAILKASKGAAEGRKVATVDIVLDKDSY